MLPVNRCQENLLERLLCCSEERFNKILGKFWEINRLKRLFLKGNSTHLATCHLIIRDEVARVITDGVTRYLIECRETNISIITLAIHNGREPRNQPIRIRSQYT